MDIVLIKPNSVQNESDNAETPYKAPRLLERLLSLLKNLRPGIDMIRMQLPPKLNMPKSQLQGYGESLYSTASDILSKCNTGKNPLERFINVVAWSISTSRPITVGVYPYYPILGETHHVSKGNLNVLIEQVSLRPPAFALHATDDKENIETMWCHYFATKFNGAAIEIKIKGKRVLKLLNFGETYEMNCPNFFIRLIPYADNDFVGDVCIHCLETGLVAELCYKTQSAFGFKACGRTTVKGNIIDPSSNHIIYEISGHWDSIVTLRDTDNGEERVIYDAKQVLSRLQAPVVKDVERLWGSESVVVWREVNQAIMSREWEKATQAKKRVEERAPNEEGWTPKHFVISQTDEGGFHSLPLHKRVPPAPIVTS